jgi:gamma-glutamylputrescine oxidase
MSDYVDSHYARTLADAARWPALAGDVAAETCVIGGGLAGLATAHALAARGRDVVLLEANRVGWGASGRSGGFVGAGFALDPETIVARVGLDHARALYALSQEAVALVRARVRGPTAPGILECALAEHGRDALAAHGALLARLGVARELWPRARVAAALATRRYGDALLDPAGFHLHPLNFTRDMAQHAAASGAALHEDSAVRRLDLAGAVKTVATARGTVRARHVVVACSGYLGRLVPALAAATVPVATYVMTTAPLGARRLAGITAVPHAVLDTRLRSDYWRPLPDTRLMWGGRVSSAHPPPARVAALLRRDMVRVFPQLADVAVDSAWVGTMGYARHKMPQLGRLGPGVWHCMGFGGFGMAATTLGGSLVAGAIAGDDDRIRLFAPFGLAYAGGRLAPAIGQLVYWGHGLRDWWRARRHHGEPS